MEGGSDPPARMADLIALRIERLPIDARRTLQAVAVVGDATDHESLRCLLPDVRSFDELLATLGVAGLVEEKDGIISTTHPLVRDVTLATIPAAVRRELHAARRSTSTATRCPCRSRSRPSTPTTRRARSRR